METQQYIQEDEIDLREYIKVLIKRKKLILSIFLVSVAIAAVASLMMPKIYEVTSTLQIGILGEPLIRNEEAKAIILNQNALLSVAYQLGLKADLEKLKRIIRIREITGTNLIKVIITYPGIDTAIKINDAVINPFIAQGNAIYQKRLVIINERLVELDNDSQTVQKDINRAQNLMAGADSSGNISQSDISLRIIFLQNALPNYESHLEVLKSKKNELKLLLANAKDFKVFETPIRPEKPISPKKRQIVSLAGALSLIFGVFLAFFLEFWKKGK